METKKIWSLNAGLVLLFAEMSMSGLKKELKLPTKLLLREKKIIVGRICR